MQIYTLTWSLTSQTIAPYYSNSKKFTSREKAEEEKAKLWAAAIELKLGQQYNSSITEEEVE